MQDTEIQVGTGRDLRKTMWLFLICLVLPLAGQAWASNDLDVAQAVASADFKPYAAQRGEWLGAQLPADPEVISQEGLVRLIGEPVFIKALTQVQFIDRVAGPALSAFAQVPSNAVFLTWILNDVDVMQHCIEGLTQTEISKRREAPLPMPDTALAIWKAIHDADPDAKDGVCLKLAIATALYPPGTSHKGVGQARRPADPLDRYLQFKAAYLNKDMARGFENLSVWEYGTTVSCNASDEDMVWARAMVNTWRPDLRINEDVVRTTSEVWRRYSPFAYSNSYKNVLSGGGMPEERASWAVFINQAFGIPVIWVTQPGHACAAYKSIRADVKPQEGNIWKVVYGRGWSVSTPGLDFLEGATLRCDHAAFMQVEKLRWLSWAIKHPEQAAAVADVGRAMTDAALTRMRTIALPNMDTEPDETLRLGAFKAPQNVGQNYRSRMRGFLIPPQSADYVFSLASDDESDLYLSPDANPSNKKSILMIRGWTQPNDFSHKSKPVSLTAGRAYYIEAVHHESTGGDHLSVAWSAPDMFTRVIAGEYLAPYPEGDAGGIVREIWYRNTPPARMLEVEEPSVKPEAPLHVAPGVLHVEAEDFANMEGVRIYDCATGGKQVNFGKRVDVAWLDYEIDPPASGVYEIRMRVAAVNSDQRLLVAVGWEAPLPVPVPNSWGLWTTTEPVEIVLQEGPQTLKVAAPHQRGVAFRWFELSPRADPAQGDPAP